MNAITRIVTDETAENPRAVIGGNMPPEPTPFERVRDKIGKLYDEAAMYLDGEPVNSQGMADDIGNLLNLIRAAEKEADEARKDEARPHDDAKAEIQTRYNALIGNTKSVKGKTVLASEACKKALQPWLEKLEAEKLAAAEKARKEAEEKAAAAQEALRARDAANLEQAAAAEALLKDAKKAERAAAKAENDGAKAGSSVFGRVVSLRTSYRPEITDATAFARFLWTAHRDVLNEFLSAQAKRLVDGGARGDALPGVVIHEEKRAV